MTTLMERMEADDDEEEETHLVKFSVFVSRQRIFVA